MMSNAALLSAEETKLQTLSEGDVRAVLRQHNPDAPAAEVRVFAEIIAFVSDVIAELPETRRREIVQAKDRLRQALVDAVARGRVERSRGTGLGARIGVEEGKARLDRYAIARPLESWAGPVAGAGEIEDRLGIPRSTLSNWQKRGAVVGLLRGERKLAYPIEQFVDARPLAGVADVVRVAPDARAAWLWLRQPHGALDGRSPLDVLRGGQGKDKVAKVAERDFA